MPGLSDIAWASLPASQLLVGPAEAAGVHRRAADLDLVCFDDAAGELQVQRLVGPRPRPSLDLIRLPAKLLHDPAALARMGLIAHRVVTARALREGTPADAVQRGVLARWQEPAARASRVAGFLEMVRLTVRETGAAADCPPLALFFLHMAHAGLMAAVLDAAGRPCSNIYTRAPRFAAEAGALLGVPLADTLAQVLDLQGDARALESPLRQLHRMARRRCPGPAWPPAIRAGTRSEFAYWRAPAEIVSRIAAARQMASEGQGPAAVFYLRYAAWSLARLAMVHRRAVEGSPHHVSFIRPERAVLPDLAEHHAPLVGPWLQVLDAGGCCNAGSVQAALQHLLSLRAPLAAQLARCDVEARLPEWRPWNPEAPDTPPMEENHVARARPVEPAL